MRNLVRLVLLSAILAAAAAAVAQESPGPVPDAAEVLSEVRKIRETDAQHGQAIAILVAAAFLLRTLAQALKEKYPDSPKLRRAMPVIVAAAGGVSGVVAAAAAGLPWIDAVVVGLSGPLAVWAHDSHAGARGFGKPPSAGDSGPPPASEV